MKFQSTLFFSYAWGDESEIGESREKIVDELYDSLVKDGYHVIRDKVNLHYTGLISEFMKTIGRGNYVVVVISDKYIKSANCMFELLELYRKSNSEINQLKEKIFPIILNDAKIYNPIDRLNYVEFWKAKKDELDKKISEVGLEYATGIVDDFRIYNEITSNIATLANLLKDMNTLNPKVLSRDNFTALKNEIKLLVTDSSKVSESPETPQSYNLAKIRKFLENALIDAELNSLCMDNFEEVYIRFTDGMNKLQKINSLIDFCKRNIKIEKLLEAMEETNSEQYQLYKPYCN